MAARWSNEAIVAEHRDLQASAMAVDYTGQFTFLAGRRCLAIINLDEPTETVKKILRQSKYEVGSAEWNPSAVNKHICAISINQRIELLNWQSCDLNSTQTLRCHTRAVSDLHWHRFDPNLLASCSIDTFIYIWDIRDTRRPAITYSAIAGATQVAWNNVSGHMLATAHDGDVKIWDHRKGTSPIQYIAAHLSKIHGLDWSPNHEHHLATSSQDSTVKFFDVTNPRRAESILSTVAPVWKARYTPFGEGLVTVFIPQLRRGENSLCMWNVNGLSSPVHTFVGHTDVVLEFQWRKRRECDYELVTWSKDQSLRIWKIEPHLQKICGIDYEVDQSDIGADREYTKSPVMASVMEASVLPPASLSIPSPPVILSEDPSRVTPSSSSTAVPMTPSPIITSNTNNQETKEIPLPPHQPTTLQQEFSLMNRNIPNVQVDEMDPHGRRCKVVAVSNNNKNLVCLMVNFPPSYPFNASPTFQYAEGTTVGSETKGKLLKVLKQVSHQHVRKNLSCLEPCLRQLVGSLEQIVVSESEDTDAPTVFHTRPQLSTFLQPANSYGSFQDANIPFPRTSGAKFCSAGMLVCFGRPAHLKRVSVRNDSSTPRSLSALGAYLSSFTLGGTNTGTPSQYNLIYPSINHSPTGEGNLSISTYYYQENRIVQKQKSRGKSRRTASDERNEWKPPKAGVVTVYDASGLMPLHKGLAERYVIDWNDPSSMCTKNAAISASIGRKDLAQIWSMAALMIASPTENSRQIEDGIPWSKHPFGGIMLKSWLDHYMKLCDIQTVAMLCCAFGVKTEHINQDRKMRNKSDMGSAGGSPYHTVHQMDSLHGNWNLIPTIKQFRSNSWSDSLDDSKLLSSCVEVKQISGTEEPTEKQCVRMLDSCLIHLYDEYRRAYSEILYKWNLLDARVKVMKYATTAPEPHKGVEFNTECFDCRLPILGSQCTKCKKFGLDCSVCRIPVRGLANFCVVCGHGGHSNHLKEWFKSHPACPAGCGCNCLDESGDVFHM